MIFLVLFGNGYCHNVASTLTKVKKLHIEKDNVVSTLPDVVQINVEIYNVDSTLI